MPIPQIGVVVPTLNRASTLPWTLHSLTSQRGLTPEILVADSGSMTGPLIFAGIGGTHNHVPPGNMYRAINAGIRQFNSEWVTYLNSDDVVFPNSYARLVNCGEEKHADLVYGDWTSWITRVDFSS